MSASIPNCDKCGAEQKELGAILLSPPTEWNGRGEKQKWVATVEKYHLCVNCFRVIRDAVVA